MNKTSQWVEDTVETANMIRDEYEDNPRLQEEAILEMANDITMNGKLTVAKYRKLVREAMLYNDKK